MFGKYEKKYKSLKKTLFVLLGSILGASIAYVIAFILCTKVSHIEFDVRSSLTAILIYWSIRTIIGLNRKYFKECSFEEIYNGSNIRIKRFKDSDVLEVNIIHLPEGYEFRDSGRLGSGKNWYVTTNKSIPEEYYIKDKKEYDINVISSEEFKFLSEIKGY